MPRVPLDVTEPPSTKRTEKTGASAEMAKPDEGKKTMDIIYRHFLGQPLKHIAAVYGMSVFVVENVVKSPMAQAELARLKRPVEKKIVEAQERIINMVPRALETQEELLECENPHVRRQVADSILDRAGLGAIERSQRETLDWAKMLELAYKKRQEREKNDGNGDAVDI